MALAVSEPLAPQNYIVPNVGGATTAVNNIGGAGAQVIGIQASRKSITFGNPNTVGQVTLLVYQMLKADGTANAPTFAAPGGGWPLLPGGMLTFTGEVQGAWGAVAQTGGANGISVISSGS